MISPHLLEIERDLNTLSLEELEWLLERIARQVQAKKETSNKLNDEYMNQQLVAMANDLDVQAEIAACNHEFGITEMDGLERF